MIQSFPCIYNFRKPISNFFSEKKWFLLSAWLQENNVQIDFSELIDSVQIDIKMSELIEKMSELTKKLIEKVSKLIENDSVHF